MPVNPERGEFNVLLGVENAGPTITVGAGEPAENYAIGSLYLRVDGEADTTLYVKEVDGAEGWAAK